MESTESKNGTARKKTVKTAIIILVAAILALTLYPLIRGNKTEEMMRIAQTEVQNPQPRKVRGEPYNEILIVYRHFGEIKAGVYNDIGETLISEEAFAAIDTDAIKREYNAVAVMKNGPRFWVMDEITGYYGGEERVLAGYRMNQPGVLIQERAERVDLLMQPVALFHQLANLARSTVVAKLPVPRVF